MKPPIFSVKLPYKVRCQLPDCGRAINLAFKQAMVDGTMCTFCSSQHAAVGFSRFREKIEKNIHPPETLPGEERNQYTDGAEEVIE